MFLEQTSGKASFPFTYKSSPQVDSCMKIYILWVQATVRRSARDNHSMTEYKLIIKDEFHVCFGCIDEILKSYYFSFVLETGRIFRSENIHACKICKEYLSESVDLFQAKIYKEDLKFIVDDFKNNNIKLVNKNERMSYKLAEKSNSS